MSKPITRHDAIRLAQEVAASTEAGLAADMAQESPAPPDPLAQPCGTCDTEALMDAIRAYMERERQAPIGGSKQLCGTCFWFIPIRRTLGSCSPPVPLWVEKNAGMVDSRETGCPCWRQREEGEAK